MSRTFVLITLFAVTAASGFACNKDKDNPAPSAAPAAAASFTPVTPESLPSRAEEEQKAASEITPDNYKAQLEQVEKEIGQP
ncbi:MAG: hypothetical protein ACRENE_24915 [Polyangiaceae bacterium]